MKIQNITSFKSFAKPIINRLKTNQSNSQVSFGRSCNDEDSKIAFVGYDCNFIPYSCKDGSFDDAQDTFCSNGIIKDSFRDDELFDSERDFVDFSYSSYDDNDVTPLREYPLTVDMDYLLYRNPDTELNKEFDTDVNVFDTNSVLPIVKPKKKQVVPKLEIPQTPYQKLDELSYLNRFSKKIYSFVLNDYLLDKYSNQDHSIGTIKKVLDLSKKTHKERYKNKYLETDEINYTRMDGIFNLLEKGLVENFDEIYSISKLADKTSIVYECDFLDVVSTLAEKYGLKETMVAVVDKYKDKRFFSVSDYNKESIITELSEKIENNAK